MRSVAKFSHRSGLGWNKLEEVQRREIQENKIAKLPESRMKPLRPIMDCEMREGASGETDPIDRDEKRNGDFAFYANFDEGERPKSAFYSDVDQGERPI